MTENPDYLGHRQRLRQRFIMGGGKSMPDYELLELLLTISIPRRDVKPLAKALIKKFGSFAEVVNAPMDELLAFDGIKENSATVIKIVKEAAIRMSWQSLENKDEVIISKWDAMIDYCRMVMAYQDVEEFRVLFLNAKFKLIGEEVQQRGTVDHVAIHPREVIKSAMNREAKAIILLHNHPSGDVTPSRADIEITKQITKAAEAVEIKVIDHVIIGKGGYYSFKDHQII
ncbi:MAG: DNA repair protein RadC [Lactobacillus sp.]|jgi:DNA repair protein RadC|nr:DNA repair protein RadC [Lactobacillus sp.]